MRGEPGVEDRAQIRNRSVNDGDAAAADGGPLRAEGWTLQAIAGLASSGHQGRFQLPNVLRWVLGRRWIAMPFRSALC
jgi:hypothetical protein